MGTTYSDQTNYLGLQAVSSLKKVDKSHLKNITANVLYLPVVGVSSAQLSMTTNGYLRTQNFFSLVRRQLRVGAVSGSLFFWSTFSFQVHDRAQSITIFLLGRIA